MVSNAKIVILVVAIMIAQALAVEIEKKRCFLYQRCPNKCKYGIAHDANGCTRCRCCRPLRCPNYCVGGYMVSKYKNVNCLKCTCKWMKRTEVEPEE